MWTEGEARREGSRGLAACGCLVRLQSQLRGKAGSSCWSRCQGYEPLQAAELLVLYALASIIMNACIGCIEWW